MVHIQKILASLTVLTLMSSVSSFGQNLLYVKDTRSIPTTPTSYSYTFEPHFKYGSSIGLTEVLPNNYYTVLGMRGWGDDSGGKSHELAFSNDGRILFRSGYSAGWGNWKSLVIGNENGFVGIGTTNPTEMLSVKGNIRAKEIKVETQNWPDFVFKDDYKHESLQELESFIKLNRHLPNIPSAKDVEVNGVELGELNKKLLQKIEEITLHLIDKDKQLQLQGLNLKLQDARIDKLEKLLNDLKPQD